MQIARVLPATPYETLDDYVADGGGVGYEVARSETAEDVIALVADAGLRGRGGAGFPTAVKWRSVVDAATVDDSEVLVACNAAEGEPATFKDRLLLDRNPYAVIEGVLIAMHAVGAERGYVAVKARFERQVARLVEARDAAVDAGWPHAARVRIVPGPDEYLFGEESAMLEVIEGKLPMPRILPPYQTGLFATMRQHNPTVVNNVETLSHVALILREGPHWFREVGTSEAPGTVVCTVVGDVARPGVWEVPLGTPPRALLVDLAGAEDIQAVYPGTSNIVITPDLLDLPLDYDSYAEAGTGLGSAGFAVYDNRRDIVQVASVLARFLAVESCGQCLACKLGTTDMFDHLDALVEGEGTATDIEEIRRRTLTVTDQNRCYLPVGAALLVASTLDRFGDAFEAHVGQRSDPAVAVQVPRITSFDVDAGVYELDSEYHRKRADWSYAAPERAAHPTTR